MSVDIEVTRDRTGETMVVHLEGLTEAGTEFLDAYNPLEMVVVDSGRIIIPEQNLDALMESCKRDGLTVA